MMRFVEFSLSMLLLSILSGCASLDMETTAEGGRSAKIHATSVLSKTIEKLSWNMNNTRTSETTGSDTAGMSGDRQTDTAVALVESLKQVNEALKTIAPIVQQGLDAYVKSQTAGLAPSTAPKTPPAATLPGETKKPVG